ncbi:MAG: sugar phosphate isomerase/epimerase family protein [Armatimonadota bacterium]|nr:sugar phosphate isomerase/epimerase family protein [Armatimonadota bacterium]
MELALHSITYAGYFYEGGALSPEEIIDRAAQHGYDAVELMAKRPICSPFDFDTSRAEKLRSYAADRRIGLTCIAGYIDLPRSNAVDREKELVFARETFRLAADLGAPSVRVYAGGDVIHEGATGWEQWEWCVEGVRELVPLAEQLGLDIVLEWHTGVVQSTPALMDMVEHIGSDIVKVMLDPPHLSFRGEDPAEAVQLVGDRLAVGHIADFERGSPMITYDAVPELTTLQSVPMNHVPLGEGMVENEAFIEACKAEGLDPTISFEVCTPFHISHRMPTLANVDELVAQAARYLRPML